LLPSDFILFYFICFSVIFFFGSSILLEGFEKERKKGHPRGKTI